MGIFDTIHASADVIEQCGLRCSNCNETLGDFQTKDLNSSMSTYYLRHAAGPGTPIKLYLLDEPDEKYWVEYTAEEIEKNNEGLQNSGWRAILTRRTGDGYFMQKGFLPENRHQRDMGENPHCVLRMYGACVCKRFIDIDVKFTDGIVVDVKIECSELQESDLVE